MIELSEFEFNMVKNFLRGFLTYDEVKELLKEEKCIHTLDEAITIYKSR